MTSLLGTDHRPVRLVSALTLLLGALVAVPLAQVASTAGAAVELTDVRLEADRAVGNAPPLRAAEVPVRLTGSADGRSAGGADAAAFTRLRADGFSLVAATWDRSASVADPGLRVRTRAGGTWTPWHRLERLGDGPTPSSPEGRAARPGTSLLWVGPSTEVEVTAARATPPGFRLVLLDPGDASDPGATDPTTVDPAATTTVAPVVRPRGKATKPPLRSRRNWKADPSWRSGTVRFSKRIKQVHVHHTATANGYAPKDVKGIIRSMYRYHTQSLGWSDLGYSFVVDQFGRAWVGRAGGVGRLVQGAHTLGFNHNSVGVAVIGNFESEQPSAAAIDTVARLAAWKLRRHTTPKRKARAIGKVRVASRGSSRFSSGTRVRLPRIDGHRDTNTTACPGELLYAQLPQIRRLAQGRIDRTRR